MNSMAGLDARRWQQQVAAHESVNPCKPDVCVSSTVNNANRLKSINQEKEMSRVRKDGGNGVI